MVGFEWGKQDLWLDGDGGGVSQQQHPNGNGQRPQQHQQQQQQQAPQASCSTVQCPKAADVTMLGAALLVAGNVMMRCAWVLAIHGFVAHIVGFVGPSPTHLQLQSHTKAMASAGTTAASHNSLADTLFSTQSLHVLGVETHRCATILYALVVQAWMVPLQTVLLQPSITGGSSVSAHLQHVLTCIPNQDRLSWQFRTAQLSSATHHS